MDDQPGYIGDAGTFAFCLILPSSLLSTTICIIVSGMITTMEETWTIKLVTVETQGVATLLIPEHTVETIQHNIKQYHTLRVPP